ncbi:MAG: DUF2309 family protein [Legionellales bacterium]|nr:DUF2309 family protein [Legionellales bacterium]
MIDSLLKDAITTIPEYWPLPSFIATNPLWDCHERPFQAVVRELNRNVGVSGVMPVSFYLELLAKAEITEDDFLTAASMQKKTHDTAISPPATLISEKISKLVQKDITLKIKQQMLQFLMNYFCLAAGIKTEKEDNDLLLAWQHQEGGQLKKFFSSSPFFQEDKFASLEKLLEDFAIAKAQQSHYLEKIFYQMLGWSSLIKWQEHHPHNLYITQKASLVDVALIWLCYEKYYYLSYQKQLPQNFFTVEETPDNDLSTRERNREDYQFMWQRAYELAYQRKLMQALSSYVNKKPSHNNKPSVQAVFCIDTRSEGLRRHLEKMKHYETWGYAGFFGFVFEYEDHNKCHTLQCPALFSPDIVLSDESSANECEISARSFLSTLAHTKKAFLSALNFVELAGTWLAFGMVLKSYSGQWVKKIQQGINQDKSSAFFNSNISPSQIQAKFPLATRVNNAAQFLKTIGLTNDFAPLILICGHGAETDNNPYHASFDCGACGGNAGWINAVVVCHILNDEAVRRELIYHGITIPKSSRFIAGFHNTTQDKVFLHEDNHAAPWQLAIAQLKKDLNLACEHLRLERSQSLPDKSSPAQRASDWAQLIPEMGLINNAALIIGPRFLTQEINLERRVFLHSYNPTSDPQGELLRSILLGPLIVAHWINAQYYFSTTDPQIFGAGNKMLHNVLPNIGVIEGNFSDLKIGLPWQSIAFQDQIIHQPLRLLVIIYAPKQLVDTLLQQHPTINSLFVQEWAHLQVIEPS